MLQIERLCELLSCFFELCSEFCRMLWCTQLRLDHYDRARIDSERYLIEITDMLPDNV